MKLKLEIIGHLGQNATVGEKDGKKVMNFSVAHTVKYGDQEQTTWVNCSWWNDNAAEKLHQYMKKGTLVAVEGVPSVRLYTDKNNMQKVSFDCNVKDVRLLSAATKEDNQQPNQEQANTDQPESFHANHDEKDLPF